MISVLIQIYGGRVIAACATCPEVQVVVANFDEEPTHTAGVIFNRDVIFADDLPLSVQAYLDAEPLSVVDDQGDPEDVCPECGAEYETIKRPGVRRTCVDCGELEPSA